MVATSRWLLIYGGGPAPPSTWPPIWWHGHEMVFGFACAAIGGFLLTAVPQWTGTPPVAGIRLALVVATWLLGRVGLWSTGLLPAAVVAVADLLYLPALAFLVTPAIRAARQTRNYPIPLLLGVLFLANLSLHLLFLGHAIIGASTGLALAVYAVIALLTIISGRVVPAFTRNALIRRGVQAEVHSSPAVERLVLAAVASSIVVDLATQDGRISGALALLAAGALFARSWGWQVRHTLGEPIVWVLHAGHAWLGLGFACKGVADLSGVFPAASAFHAFTAGAIGTLAMAVMSRAALGHSGRPLQASAPLVLAYVLVILGAVMRVALPPLLPATLYPDVVLLAGTVWASAYLVFTVSLWPVLTRPRSDA